MTKVIGKDTMSAVRSGFFWGYAGLIDNIVNLIKTIRDNPSYGVIKGLIDLGNNFGERELNGLKIYKKNELENLSFSFSNEEWKNFNDKI